MWASYTKYWQNYLNFHSKTSRKDYWTVFGINVAIRLITLIFIVIAAVSSIQWQPDIEISNLTGVVIAFILIGLLSIYEIATLIPNIMISLRRIKDAGLSQWWYALVILAEAPIGFGNSNSDAFILTVSGIAGLALFIIYLLPTKEPAIIR